MLLVCKTLEISLSVFTRARIFDCKLVWSVGLCLVAQFSLWVFAVIGEIGSMKSSLDCI